MDGGGDGGEAATEHFSGFYNRLRESSEPVHRGGKLLRAGGAFCHPARNAFLPRLFEKTLVQPAFPRKQFIRMSPTFTLQLSDGPIDFIRVVRLTRVDGVFDSRPMVWFDDYDQDLGQERKGVVIVVQDGKEVLYCARLKNRSFTQTWLYGDGGYLFKQRINAAKAVEAGHKLEIYLSTRASAADETVILSEMQPLWNGRR